MEETYSQRVPAPGRTWLRLADRTWDLQDGEWEWWVRRGWVPPEALILSALWTKGVWRRAESLEVYHLFRPSDAARPIQGAEPAGEPEPARTTGLPSALWGSGLSMTQLLVMANLLVSAILVLAWRDAYTENLWRFSGKLRSDLSQGWAPVLLVPLFLHASSSHLIGNMLGLTAAGAAVEEFYGRLRTILFYLAAGLCGAGVSLLRVKPVLSVGASGAIMGLYGVTLVFLLRYRNRFSERQKWKTTRVYFPLLVLALLPSLFMADFFSHAGGFVGGVLFGFLVPAKAERLPRPEGR